MAEPMEIRKKIDQQVNDLFEFNQKVVAVLRQQAKDFEVIASFFEQQKQRAYDIAALNIDLAEQAASVTGDIIMAEFGLGLATAPSDEEEGLDE